MLCLTAEMWAESMVPSGGPAIVGCCSDFSQGFPMLELLAAVNLTFDSMSCRERGKR
jgi:hypothetical protein